MAVADDLERTSSPEFDRQPPQDFAAEQSVLGGMLLSKDAIADVIETVRGGDFYRPAHQLVYDTIIDLYSRGEPADPVTVSSALTKSGNLLRVGGAPYLHTLISSVPTAANAGYYATIVAERAILRRLVEAGTRIVQLGYGAASGRGGEVDEIVDRAQAEVYDVTERRMSEDYVVLEKLLQGTMDEIDAISSRGGVSLGVKTGFEELDEKTHGLHPGQLVLVAARPALGKALALDTALPTPTGWTSMGAVAVGDWLLGADGRPTRVVAATEVMVDRPCFEVEFSDGTVITADADHQWRTTIRVDEPAEYLSSAHRVGDRQPLPDGSVALYGAAAAEAILGGTPVDGSRQIVTTFEIGALANCGAPGQVRHAIAVAAALQLPEVAMPVRPYVLGLSVGAGAAQGIPPEYLRSSAEQRHELLSGVLDAQKIEPGATGVHLAFTELRLAADVVDLVISNGYLPVNPSEVSGHREDCPEAPYRVSFVRSDAARAELDIVDVREVPSVAVRCVQVDNDDHMYLASEAMIPTHNSTLALDIARNCSIKNAMTSVIFSLEMSKSEITMRLLSAEAKVPLHHMRSGHMNDDDWTKLGRRMGEVADAPLYIDDSPNLTMMEIRAKSRRLKQRHDLRLVIVDYLQLMTSGRKVESRQQEVSEFSRQLKLLAKELDVPVIAVCQLNRGPEQRQDKKPMLSDLRESGCLPASTRILRADTGAEVTIGSLFASGERDIPVWSLDDRLRLVPKAMAHAFSSGIKEVFRLRLTSGREIEATANHPFLTMDGWIPLRELTVGSRVGVPRHVGAPLHLEASSNGRVAELARAVGLGDGSAEPFSHVPAEVFSFGTGHVRLFLHLVWGARGVIAWDESSGACRLGFDSAHRRVVDDLARLLLRCNVMTRIEAPPDCRSGEWRLSVSGAEQQQRFLDEIGISGPRRAAAAEFAERLRAVTSHTEPSTIPDEIWTRVRGVLHAQAPPQRAAVVSLQTSPRLSSPPMPARSGERLGSVAAVLNDAAIEIVATNDIFWDAVAEITSLGEQETYDATVPGTHNFVANGVSVHNSLEQDADVVLLIHREDFYEPESPRAGEADLLVVKHRNGPTGTVTVAFQGHYSRFVDMAR
ncbi:MAG: replicative DNA helicase [Geodermatophilaceae bacterium]|nr:replicative DNA helicase [Geodermatophilaceae bacterium]